ncbi:hypothetical protein Ddye_021171 [Dipteronia dyeriana]|uniref:Heat shock factor binding protein 1 n=1 Tax=Dipteronia dyeriana TaxID=168575 RepID=A0AAD9WWN5_9ROSI|nr:hypothetical protein Ddye_021171 [Dipteronia dyeriana]
MDIPSFWVLHLKLSLLFSTSESHAPDEPMLSFNLMSKRQVQNLLQQMQSRFQTMSESIISKIDEMGSRIDELEQSINELRTEMGIEASPSPSAPLKPKEESKSANDSA